MRQTAELLCCLLCACALAAEAAPSLADSMFSQHLYRVYSRPRKDEQTNQHVAKEDEQPSETCGYQTCNLGVPDMLNVHLVPHTHDDVGWLKTVDQYYYGARNNIQHASVQYILDSVIDELQKDPRRRFIYVEVAFFYRWWNQQHDSMRHIVKGLVDQGRLEFILGGWCMNDEASTHYNAIIDQHTLGFQFLQENFGECARPKIGWQIDPFGHSREQASLFAQFGFDGLFFGRLDYQDKEQRLKNKTMELVWMGSDNLGDQASLFTGVNYNLYMAPGGFCFDVHCSDDPIMDDDRLHDYNVKERVDDFIKAVKKQALNYTTNHIMMTMGSDFQFEYAKENFDNLDKLIKYINARQASGSKINAFYSTPSCYLYALNQAKQTYTKKTDDFFPYASRAHSFWSGYFTSRPALKRYVRVSNNFLQVSKQMDSLAQLGPEHGSNIKIDKLRQAMGVAQHHDAVSGTEKQEVAYDYALRLANGTAECQDVVNDAFSKLAAKTSVKPPTQVFCNLLNVSYCPFTETHTNFTVTLYNPIGRSLSSWVRFPITGKAYEVLGPNKVKLTTQIIPISPETQKIPAHNGSRATGELLFKASLPPLGFQTFFVQELKGREAKLKNNEQQSKVTTLKPGEDIELHGEQLKLRFDGKTGSLIVINGDGQWSQSLLYYEAAAGDNHNSTAQASGAYIFRPNGTKYHVVGEKPIVRRVDGPLVSELHVVLSDWASLVARVYARVPEYMEFEYTVGPIPIKDNVGKEVVNRFYYDKFNSSKTWYTDANGREMITRVRDFRQTWKLNQTEPVAGNYYPVNSRMYIRDIKSNTQMTILNDRSQGGASLADGEMELMVHRRLLYDDGYGVGEALSEPGISGKGLVVRGKHYVIVDAIGSSAKDHRDMGEKLFMAPTIMFASTGTMTPDQYSHYFNTQWSGLKQALPANVHLLTLEQWAAGTLLLRLEHFYEKGEDPALSKPASVSLKGLFVPFEVESVQELTLGANQLLKDAKRLQWNIKDFGPTKTDPSSYFTPVDPSTLTVVLQPMQIRTFQVTLAGKH